MVEIKFNVVLISIFYSLFEKYKIIDIDMRNLNRNIKVICLDLREPI